MKNKIQCVDDISINYYGNIGGILAKKFANNKWVSKSRGKVPIRGKRFSVQYFHSYTDQEFFKVVNAEDSQQAIAKFQEAVRWGYDKIGIITEVLG